VGTPTDHSSSSPLDTSFRACSEEGDKEDGGASFSLFSWGGVTREGEEEEGEEEGTDSGGSPVEEEEAGVWEEEEDTLVGPPAFG